MVRIKTILIYQFVTKNDEIPITFLETLFFIFIGNRGCVGLCLYNKMHGIKDESSGDEPKKAEVKVIYVSLDNIGNKEFLLCLLFPLIENVQ